MLGLPTGCAGGGDSRPEAPNGAAGTVPPATAPAATRPPTTTEAAPFSEPQQAFPPYEPLAEEEYRNGKRLAGRVAQRLATFGPLASAAEIADVEPMRGDPERAVAPLVDPDRRSSGEVAYVQLSGVTATTLGAMVLVRQHLEDGSGRREVVERVMDIRLSRTDGPWRLDQVASVGGAAAPRPARLSAAAARVLDHPNIDLPDTARWDIHRGLVADELLAVLADAADGRRLAVLVLRTGHPRNVWASPRVSAHTAGRAADIYAVDGAPVLLQRQEGSSAHRLVAELLEAGARQVGSPWVLPPGGRRSFTDPVHQDHVHVHVQR